MTVLWACVKSSQLFNRVLPINTTETTWIRNTLKSNGPLIGALYIFSSYGRFEKQTSRERPKSTPLVRHDNSWGHTLVSTKVNGKFRDGPPSIFAVIKVELWAKLSIWGFNSFSKILGVGNIRYLCNHGSKLSQNKSSKCAKKCPILSVIT